MPLLCADKIKVLCFVNVVSPTEGTEMANFFSQSHPTETEKGILKDLNLAFLDTFLFKSFSVIGWMLALKRLHRKTQRILIQQQ